MTSLGLLAAQRKRHHLMEIGRSLRAIHTLERMGQRVQELLHGGGGTGDDQNHQEDYAAAIQLLVEGRQAAQTYRHFHCVAQLTSRLQDMLEMAEEQLDVGLAKCCQSFDPLLYGKLQKAFALLGKQSAALDQLSLHLSTVLHQRSLAVVKEFADSSRIPTAPAEYNKLQFQDLVRLVDPSSFMACFQELCTCFWNVTMTYHQIHQWHEDHPGSGSEQENQGEVEFAQKLLHGRVRLWQDVQNKTRAFLLSSDLWHFHIDDFLRVLDTVDRLILVGTQFCPPPSDSSGGGSDVLRECIRQQSVAYFRTFHRGRLDELRVFLEHESWERCPVRPDFDIFHLTEFDFLNSTPVSGSDPSRAPIASPGEQFYSAGAESPFLLQLTDSREKSAEVKKKAKDDLEEEGSTSPDGPLLANTTLSVLRLFGRYVHFMRLLRTIAFDVLICLNQLFDFYLLAVYRFFGTRPTESCDAAVSPKLRTVLNRIAEMLILRETVDGTAPAGRTSAETAEDPYASSFTASDRVPCPQISPLLQIDHVNQLYGLRIRLVAAESVVFLARQMTLLRPYLLELIPSSKEPSLEQFVLQVAYRLKYFLNLV